MNRKKRVARDLCMFETVIRVRTVLSRNMNTPNLGRLILLFADWGGSFRLMGINTWVLGSEGVAFPLTRVG